MKKTILGLSILAFASVFASCDAKQTNVQTNKDVSFENMYDYSAISGISLLNNSANSGLKKSRVSDTEKQEILDNLSVIEGMMESNITKSEEKESDKEEYEKMYTLLTTSFDGNEDLYTFYYNETIIRDYDDDDDLFEEKEEESRIDGLVIMNGTEYTMVGEKEVEGKDIEMKFKIQLDENNYVVIEQEQESDEEEFSYTKFENGVKVFDTSLELSKGLFDKDFEYSFKKQSSEGMISYKYELETIGYEKYVIVKKIINDVMEVIKIKVVKDSSGNINYIFE